MESKELFYILLIIILILNLMNKKETFLNLLSKKDTFLNSKNTLKEDIQNNKNKNKNIIRKQYNSKFDSLQDFYDKRPKFEIEPLGNNEPLVEYPKRHEKLLKAVKKKEYLPAYEPQDNFINNSGKPGFYIK
tara:strand:- start:1011 stop:1406 length:396 start_codon:yes stop_codon:yes gene_type:complete